MDPFSIFVSSATLADICIKVSVAVFALASDSATVDSRLVDLGREIENLSRVLDAIGKSDLKAASNDPTSSAQGLLDSLHASLGDCKITLEKLKHEFVDLRHGRGLFGWTGRPGRQLRLLLKTKDISELKQQIQAHVHDMQLALSAINLCLQLQGNYSTGAVLLAVAGLQSQLNRVEKALESTGSLPPQSPGEEADHSRFSQNRQQLFNAVARIQSNASSVASEARSTIYNPSVFGYPISAEAQERISEWITQPNAEDTGVPGTAGLRDDFDVEVTEMIEKLAVSAFSSGDYSKAETYLSDLILHGHGLMTDTRLAEFKLLLAFSHAFLDHWDDLANLVDDSMITLSPTLELARAHLLHAIASVRLSAKQYEAAMAQCKKSMAAKRLVDGKGSPSYEQSVLLLHQIYSADNDPVKAEACLMLLPADIRLQAPQTTWQYLEHFMEVIPFVKEARQSSKQATQDREASPSAGVSTGIPTSQSSPSKPIASEKVPVIVASSGSRAVVLWDFHARSSDEVTIQKGQSVDIVETDAEYGDGWYLGKVLETGATGLFPAAYIQPVRSAPVSGAESNDLVGNLEATIDDLLETISPLKISKASENTLSPNVLRRSQRHI